MPAETPFNEMAALLRVLENVERAVDERRISTVRQLTELQGRTKSELANSGSEDQCANPFVDRIAAAMLKLRNQSRGKPIG
jgi:hypothetical protein